MPDSELLSGVERSEWGLSPRITNYVSRRPGGANSKPGETGSANETSATPEKLWELCCDFEAIFLGKLMQQMRNTTKVPGGAIPTSSPQDMFQDLFESELARSLVQRTDWGLARLLFQRLEEQLKASGPPFAEGET